MRFASLCSGALLCGLIILVGCAETEVAQPESEKAGGGTDATSEFEIVKPASFTGEFNPAGLDVGNKVGQLAPEIEGPDLDGVDFKLSDYRGKVVLLDFYGDW